MNSNPLLGTARQSFQYLQTIMAGASVDSNLDVHMHPGAVPRTPRPPVSEVRRSKCGRGSLRSSDGTAGVGQAPELPLFSPPTRTREEELQRLQLIEGGKKLEKLSLRQPAAVLSMKDFPHAAHATGTAESSSSGRRYSYSGPRKPRSISTAKRSHHGTSSLTNDLGSRRRRSTATPNRTGDDHDENNLMNDLGSGRPPPIPTVNRSDESNLTNDLLKLLISEMARLRSTLERLVEDRAVVEEVRRTNKLIALTLASGRSLEGHDNPSFHPLLAKKIKDKSKSGEIILDSI